MYYYSISQVHSGPEVPYLLGAGGRACSHSERWHSWSSTFQHSYREHYHVTSSASQTSEYKELYH